MVTIIVQLLNGRSAEVQKLHDKLMDFEVCR